MNKKNVTYKMISILTLISTPAGTMIGRNDKECGQIGHRMIAGTLGWTIEAPADTA